MMSVQFLSPPRAEVQRMQQKDKAGFFIYLYYFEGSFKGFLKG